MQPRDVDRLSVRKIILAAAIAHEDWKLLARMFGVNECTASNWITTARKREEWAPDRAQWGGKRHQKIYEHHVERILEAVSVTPDMTLEEMASIVATDFRVIVTATWRTCRSVLDTV
ncbi:hypothetical protein H310_13962 [Aphanomyces invadans]|uniref:Transposase Synechocystis PCC 6803 domain-containing protein n=1 Tax=Aphanomyces invadans TaxID=157072 RepID=A0A024TBM0_9STRA|nr:hypothetical protein H310_13962 [Aphanomyces invadans]ETV91413.1 hypothetical protein H310_13962 [Aphanomyces invadans]|eukprot:XP_008879865.1 hypothetical protein H310_13962 [Aphanomyces invadans]